MGLSPFPDAPTVARTMAGDAMNAIMALPLAYEHGVLEFFEAQGEDSDDVPMACAILGAALQILVKSVWGREAWPKVTDIAVGHQHHKWILEELEVRAATHRDLDDEYERFFGGSE